MLGWTNDENQSRVFKRNAKAFSPNAIVDVRLRRRHQMICWNISETVRASDVKIYHKIALDSLYISTRKWRHKLLSVGSESYKRVNFGSRSGRDFSITVQPILKRFTILEIVIQGLHFSLCNLLDVFAPWPRKWGSIGPAVVYAFHMWLILICSETTNASSFKI